MNDFREGETQWTISCKLNYKTYLGRKPIKEFDNYKKGSLTLDNEKGFEFYSKNEAIDAMLLRLHEMKE